MRKAIVAVAVALAGGVPVASARAANSSLYSGPGPKPGPAILYQAPATAPQLTNAGPWKAPPILVSGASAYRDGEFLYQDYLYDDHGARGCPTRTTRASRGRQLLASPTAPTPTRPARDTPTTPPTWSSSGSSRWRRDRVPHHAQHDREPVAGRLRRSRSAARPAPPSRSRDGANVSAPASLFLTVHRPPTPTLISHAGSGQPVDAAPRRPSRSTASAARSTSTRPPRSLEPGPEHRSAGRRASGLWNAANQPLPAAPGDRRRNPPGRRRRGGQPAGVLQRRLPVPPSRCRRSPTAQRGGERRLVARPRAGHRARRRRHLARSSPTSTSPSSPRGRRPTEARRRPDDRPHGPDPRQPLRDRSRARDFAASCGSTARPTSSSVPEFTGQLQPYAIYVPARPRPAARLRA